MPAIRLVGALILETNDEWAVAPRYMNLETFVGHRQSKRQVAAVATRAGSDLPRGQRSNTKPWNTIPDDVIAVIEDPVLAGIMLHDAILRADACPTGSLSVVSKRGRSMVALGRTDLKAEDRRLTPPAR
ncbi:hypothetical protein [Paracoccus marinaquae]|uniref:Transposase n=1 Tax=Paracoccus marinaquae TaxID=2841926 RepID=A0ABS6AQ56_9RHOB|nr:hypothetical protein [Paracoccus marinaquae]MBU3032262.1 hypothetical protein [Paracoccus marinaquae]